MCGIAGNIVFKNQTTTLTELEEANQRQFRRGPDSSGVYHARRVGLAHRRLKIFDLTDRAAQPMVDEALGLALVFNGEIYNFRELKKELVAKGYQFRSESDTEVVLKAYHAWGEEAISRLEGMFAFGIWETENNRLILARDRLGIKPLYYSVTPDGFRFASTVQALLAFKDVDRTLDPAALHYYLTFHAVPEPLTLLRGIRKLAPGTMQTVDINGNRSEKNYWQLTINEENTTQRLSEGQWLWRLESTLRSAVKRQMEADVPIGILLSGGLDSSLLVALTKGMGPRRQTFSIGFESTKNETGDEFYYSDMVASAFSTDHHKLFISNHELLISLEECVRAMTEPMTSHDNIGFYLLSREVAKHVKVVLSGQGADEVFAGYHWFHTLACKPQERDDIDHYTACVFDRDYREYCETVTQEFRTGNLSRQWVKDAFTRNGSKHLVDNALALDATFALANGPLSRVDNMTMASSLEARVPFLDEQVIELAAAMPLSMKMPDGGKYLLKKLARKLLPKEVVDRPKGYFPVPALKTMEGPYHQLMQEVLNPERIARRGIFNLDYVAVLLQDPKKHLTSFGASKLWQLGLLEYWMQLHEI